MVRITNEKIGPSASKNLRDCESDLNALIKKMDMLRNGFNVAPKGYKPSSEEEAQFEKAYEYLQNAREIVKDLGDYRKHK